MALKSKNPIVAEINKNFVIRWRNNGESKRNLIGGGRYHDLVGEELKEKHFDKVLSQGEQVYIFKLRRGIIVEFVSK